MAALQDGMKDVDLEGGSPVEESTAAPEGPSTDRSAEPSSSAIDGILSEVRTRRQCPKAHGHTRSIQEQQYTLLSVRMCVLVRLLYP